jgi:UDP:flavonoid glycosyltransferase YjiC (YdhE family)
MKVLLTTGPAYGHFHPMVPLAKAIEQSGHEVVVACSRSFCPVVEEVGLRAIPAGLDWHADNIEETFPQIKTMTPDEATDFTLRFIFSQAAAQQMASDLVMIAKDLHFDVIVREFWEFGGYIAAEVLNLPHATLGIGFAPSMDYLTTWIGRQLDGLRAAYGLPPDPQLTTLFRHLYLHCLPDTYQPVASAGKTAYSIRPPLFDRTGTETLPDWVDKLPARPVVYATLGTICNKTNNIIFDMILAGLHDEPCNLILTVGRTQNPDAFGPQPDNIHIERYIPQTLLFSHCDMVITHGGYNTVMSALSHGLPLLVVPIGADQPAHAERCAELGVARVISPDRLNPQAIRDGVREILGNADYRERARSIQNEIAAMPDISRAVELLEDLVPAP